MSSRGRRTLAPLAQLGFVETRYLVASAPLPEALVPTAALLRVRDRRRR